MSRQIFRILITCLVLSALCTRLFAEDAFFNGENFEGWTRMNGQPVGDGWEVLNGVIHRKPNVKRAGHIISNKEYGDFDFRFEWMIPEKGNSGIKYRVRKYGGKIRGLEFQIVDDQSANHRIPPDKLTASLYDLYPPNRHKTLKPSGEFNQSRIVVRNDTVLHYLNGMLVLSANIGSQEWEAKVAESKFSDLPGFGTNQLGKIMLTDHGCEVWYRNLKFTELETNIIQDPTQEIESGMVDFQLRDFLGKKHRLSEVSADIVVLAFLGTECPLAKLYSQRLVEISKQFEGRVRFFGVNSNAQDSLTEIASFARKHRLNFPILKDLGNKLADQVAVDRAPQVVVLDSNRQIRYRGQIDDQYLVGVARDKATNTFLIDALQSILAGGEVAVSETQAVGCLIGRTTAKDSTTAHNDITFSKQISRILQRRCIKCHRAGDIGPFELQDYDEVVGWSDMMKEVIEQQRMPPWHADPEHGEFANDASMPESEKQQFYRWVEAGCPEGDPDDLPTPLEFTEGWQLPSEPDVVIPMSKDPYKVPADVGPKGVPYQYFTVESAFAEDKWVTAAEVQPGNKSVVHHIIVYAQPPKKEGRRHWIFLTAYVPGLRYEPLPPKSAKLIPADSTLIFEMHYTPVGSPQSDISRLGLIFTDPETITHEIVTTEIACYDFEIPPNEDNHRVSATSQPIKYSDVRLRSLSPHMHLRGKSFLYELITKDGKRKTLLDVPSYDFNWQTTYVLKEPLKLPKGSLVHCKAAFDNSTNNMANPNPNRTVTWGDQSWDEMMIGFCDVIVPIKENRRPGRKLLNTGINVVGVFDDTDRNGDSMLSKSEANDHPVVKKLFDVLDFDKNQQLELMEALRAIEMLRN